MVVLKKITLLFLLCLFLLPVRAQEFQPTPAQRGVRTSGDVAVGMLAAAGLTAVLVQKDWQGLKQGALSGVTTLGVTYALKYLVKKERPDHSDFHSFPSMHTSAVFTAAAFIQRRYGWKWGAPAYACRPMSVGPVCSERSTTGGMWPRVPPSVWEAAISIHVPLCASMMWC